MDPFPLWEQFELQHSLLKICEEGSNSEGIFKKEGIKHAKQASYFRTRKKLACHTQPPTFWIPTFFSPLLSQSLKFCLIFNQTEVKCPQFYQYSFTLSREHVVQPEPLLRHSHTAAPQDQHSSPQRAQRSTWEYPTPSLLLVESLIHFNSPS